MKTLGCLTVLAGCVVLWTGLYAAAVLGAVSGMVGILLAVALVGVGLMAFGTEE